MATSNSTPWAEEAPSAGLVPKRGFERVIFVWAMVNIILTLLPVFAIAGNGADMVLGILPLTIFWSYAVFLSNVAMGVVYFIVRSAPWAEAMEGEQR